MMITASYRLTYAHYNAMCRAGEDRMSRLVSRWLFWPLVLVNLLLGFVLFIDRIEANLAIGWVVWVNFGVAIALLSGRYLVVPMLRRSAFRSMRLGGRDYRVGLGDNAIEIEAGGLTSQIAVSEIICASETVRFFFLWFNKRQGAIIPKDAVDPPHGDADIRRYIVSNEWKLEQQ